MKQRNSVYAVFATIAVLSAGSLAAHAENGPIPWRITENKPTISVGKEVAFFVWHVADEVYVEATNMNAKGDVFSGTVTVQDGAISDPEGIALEKNDSVTQVNVHTLTFKFHTYTGLDGVKFHVDRAASRVNMDLDMDGLNPMHIYAGGDNVDLAASQESDGYLHFIVRADDDPEYNWSLTAGAPSIKLGAQNAYYVWHDAEYVYVVCTGDSTTVQNFDGEVRLHTAPISDITAMNDDSTYDLLEPNIMRWYFKTANGETGLRYKIGADSAAMGFTFHLDGTYTSHVYFGKNMVQLPRNDDDTIVFNLYK